MQLDTVTDREAPPEELNATPPERPRRRRWRWRWPGSGFLDRPGGDEYANRWQAACGQGG